MVIGLIGREGGLKQAEGKGTDTERHLKVHAVAEAEILDCVGRSRRACLSLADLRDCDEALGVYRQAVAASYY